MKPPAWLAVSATCGVCLLWAHGSPIQVGAGIVLLGASALGAYPYVKRARERTARQ